MSSDLIRLRGVRVHNLKNIDLDIPRGELVVFTGVSGSGKSSLAFDTLYAEGQRRYVETFSAYTRQFLERLDKPDADSIEGLPPALAVSQRVSRRSRRSTVGTVTEIYDYLGLLYARSGVVACTRCGETVAPADPAAVVRAADALPAGTRYLVAYPLEVRPDSDRLGLADALREDGFLRVRVDGVVSNIDEGPLPMPADGVAEVVVDRLVRGNESASRRVDSIETAFAKGLGRARIITDAEVFTFYRGYRCARCGQHHAAPDPRLFRFNSPLGACPECEGFGMILDIDMSKVVPDPRKSIRAGAIAPWTTPAYREHNDALVNVGPSLGIPVDLPFADLSAEQVARVLEGARRRGYLGLKPFFTWLERKVYKLHVRVYLSRWRGESTCPSCVGKRLRPEALAVRVGGLDIADLSARTVDEARDFLDAHREGDPLVARRAIDPVLTRLDYLRRIGLGYLTLDRPARTLSAGESRRVSLTTALGSGLVNTLYILDEPSIGLHPRDVGRLVETLAALRDAGNSVVVVEHDAAIMRAADRLVDVGPGAGADGGRIVFQGTPAEAIAAVDTATGAFLAAGPRGTSTPRRAGGEPIRLEGASGNNLKDVDVNIPTGVLCVVTGVSGSGKSTLVDRTLYPALSTRLADEPMAGLPYRALTVPATIGAVALVDASPIGRSGRSNPATYLKVFDEVRAAFAATHEAKARKYGAGHFSFNVEGGRCNACEGSGYQTIDMQFLADIMVRCPECRGRRYRPETLEITYKGKNIAEVLDLTAREAFPFFRHLPKAQAKLRPLLDVGLEYLRLGQPGSTLSGGEAQRLKLAGYLSTSPGAMTRASTKAKTVFLLDEPTTGLHPADTAKLLQCLNGLADLGHTLIVVEHSPEVMAAADWIIDVGPEAGVEGGRIVAEGTPEQVALADTPTGRVLAATLGDPAAPAGPAAKPPRARRSRG